MGRFGTGCLNLQGKVWYNRLKLRDPQDRWALFAVKPELRDHRVDSPRLIISLQRYIQTFDGEIMTRYFADFESYPELFHYLRSFQGEHAFYEVILGHHPQRMKFDLDQTYLPESPPPVDLDEIVDALAVAMKRVLREEFQREFNPRDDVFVFVSSPPPTPTKKIKRSAHLVFPRIICQSAEDCRWLFKCVVNLIPECMREFVDESVYSSVQQFRLLGSQKLGSGRIKLFRSEWFFEDEPVITRLPVNSTDSDRRQLVLLERSLASWSVGDDWLPSKLPIEKNSKPSFKRTSTSLSERQVNRLVKRTIDASIFKVREVIDDLVILNRQRPSYCPVCLRVHEKEHPYLILTRTGVEFCCRRNPQRLRISELSSYQFTRETIPVPKRCSEERDSPIQEEGPRLISCERLNCNSLALDESPEVVSQPSPRTLDQPGQTPSLEQGLKTLEHHHVNGRRFEPPKQTQQKQTPPRSLHDLIELERKVKKPKKPKKPKKETPEGALSGCRTSGSNLKSMLR